MLQRRVLVDEPLVKMLADLLDIEYVDDPGPQTPDLRDLHQPASPAPHPIRSGQSEGWLPGMTLYPDMTNFPLPVLPALDYEVHNASILDLVLATNLGQPPAIVFAAPGRGLFNNAVRLMDKTVLEYKAARAACVTFVETVNQSRPALSHYFRAIDHVETCVGSLHRTLLHLDAINITKSAPRLDRTKRRVLEHAKKEIKDLRNLIEHADDELRKMPPTEGISILYLEADRLQLGETSIKFADLALWINQTYRLLRTLFASPGVVSPPGS